MRSFFIKALACVALTAVLGLGMSVSTAQAGLFDRFFSGPTVSQGRSGQAHYTGRWSGRHPGTPYGSRGWHGMGSRGEY